MTQLRFIAMVPLMRRDAYREPVRDDDGKIIFDGYRLHHNAKLYEESHRARREANAFGAYQDHDGQFGRVLEVNLDELPDAESTVEQQYQFAERQMLRWATEHGRLADIVHGKTGDKSDRDYHVRVKRNAEFCAHATTEMRRLLEMFKPPDYVITVERDKVIHGWKGEFPKTVPDVRTEPFVVGLRDPRPDGSDAHIYSFGQTEGAAYASMLETLVAGRGFFPGT